MRLASLVGVGLTRRPTITAPQLYSLSADAGLAEVVHYIADGLVPTFDEISGQERKFTKALAYWYHLNGLYLVEDAQAVLKFMSEEQKTSFRLMREWWTAQYQRPETTFGYIHELVWQGCELTEQDDEDVEFVLSVENSLRMLRAPHDVIFDPTLWVDRLSTYNIAMRHLFEAEFNDTGGIDGRNKDHSQFREEVLKPLRRNAVIAAWTQQMAFASFRQDIFSHFEAQDKPDEILEHDPHWSHLQDVRVQPNAIEKYRPSPMIAATLSNRSLLAPRPLWMGPVIKPCPWLSTGRAGLKVDMPYYLWDREDHKTIASAELLAFVDYTCISHTWGRYTLPSMEAPEYVSVPGVPWKLPRNSKFDVTKLGDQLDKLGRGIRYIWIDLFCIPQDGSEPMAAEIARQAEIFLNATHVIAWLNDVDNFEGLAIALSMMAISLIYLPEGCEEREFAVHLIECYIDFLADKSTSLLLPRENKFDALYIQSNPWFTSLWTLQELCLRPDMWLCSADFDILTIVENEPMPIIGIVAFYDRWKDGLEGNRTEEQEEDNDDYYFKFDDRGTYPSLPDNIDGLAFPEIGQWIQTTALYRLLDMSIADILVIGDKRICLSRRAEAIMSCLGATKWYHDIARTDHENALVLNKYPVAFVAEVQANDPVAFFGRITKHDHNPYDAAGINLSISLDPANRRDPTKHDDFQYIPAQPRGTALPFSMHGCAVLPAAPSYVDTFDCHDAIKSWVVQHNGRVHIPTACILASTDESFGPFQHIQGELTTESTTLELKPFSIDLQKWIQARSFECHALVLATRTLLKTSSAIGTAHDEGQLAAVVFHGFVLGKFSDRFFVKLSPFLAIVRKSKKRSLPVIPPTTVTGWLVA